jgi:alginate O-acetyltransferase complex protein AlgI
LVFSSAIFLFGFLPLILAVYYLSPRSIKNGVLLTASLAFYAWGEVFYVGVMLASIVINYAVGLGIARFSHDLGRKAQQLILGIGVVLNLSLLVSFKYANFIVDNLNGLLGGVRLEVIDLAHVHLPLGISFFTFQAISYIVDVYRKEVEPQRSLFDLALYISLFPQLSVWQRSFTCKLHGTHKIRSLSLV